MSMKRLLLAITILAVIVATWIGVSSASAAPICTPATAISVPFMKDGAGDFCYVTSNLCNYINSWNMTALEVNGTAYNNLYVPSSSIAPVGGTYTIHYVGPYAWSHFEIGGPCGTPTTPPPGVTNTPTRTPTRTSTGGITATRTRTPTRTATGPTATRTRTPTRTNTPAISNTPTRTPTRTSTGGITNTPTRTPTRTFTPPPGITNTPTRTPTNPPQGTHLTNPFSGANAYVNPFWGGSTRGFSTVNTAIWMDTIMAVNGTNGYPNSLNGFMDDAVAKGKNLISVVVYNLPGRDCAALASNGLLPATEAGLTTYKTDYIDPIAAAVAAHPSLRVILIIEPDSLPNLVTNLSDPDCSNVNSQTLYQRGTSYALTKFKALSNAYTYIDIGHAGWLGWPSNFDPAITLISNVVKAANGGNCTTCTDGFADGTANTQVEVETFLDANTMINGQPVRQQSFFDWNTYIDESHFATAWKAAMQGAGGLAAGSTNMVIDTSRNGWGGCGGGSFALQTCRPTAQTPVGTLTLDQYVNANRIDRRPAKGNWCNQNGSGLGKPPLTTAPLAPYQAYLWIKPPAESDGSSTLIPIGPDNPDGKGFDQMCDPNYMGNSLNQNKNSNALPGAPVSGRWFQAQWDQLVANKFP
jgi:cellulose 1,4-beta-cellobiosidase